MMYIPDGWGSVYAIDVSSGKKGEIKWKFDPGVDRAWAGDVACCGVNNRGVALWKDKVISIALDGRIFAIDRATGEKVLERKVVETALGETKGAKSASSASAMRPTSTPASRLGVHTRISGAGEPATRPGPHPLAL